MYRTYPWSKLTETQIDAIRQCATEIYEQMIRDGYQFWRWEQDYFFVLSPEDNQSREEGQGACLDPFDTTQEAFCELMDASYLRCNERKFWMNEAQIVCDLAQGRALPLPQLPGIRKEMQKFELRRYKRLAIKNGFWEITAIENGTIDYLRGH